MTHIYTVLITLSLSTSPSIYQRRPSVPNYTHTHTFIELRVEELKMRGGSNTRWCPTPQQVMVLEQLYTRGLKTPTASQIQKITAHLSLYGNIQGKNVFYWFQNHKARDRQKLRKSQLHLHYHRLLHHHHFPSPSPSPSLHNIIHFQVLLLLLLLLPYNIHTCTLNPVP